LQPSDAFPELQMHKNAFAVGALPQTHFYAFRAQKTCLVAANIVHPRWERRSPKSLSGYLRGHFALLQREKQRRKGRKERENIKKGGKNGTGEKHPSSPEINFWLRSWLDTFTGLKIKVKVTLPVSEVLAKTSHQIWCPGDGHPSRPGPPVPAVDDIRPTD